MPESEIIDAESRPLAVREETTAIVTGADHMMFPAMTAAQRANEMVELAKVFVGLARDRDKEAKAQNRPPLIVEMVDKKTGRKSEHLTIGLWQTLGALLPRAVTAIPEWTRAIENGYEARAIVQTLDGRTIGAAEHQCDRSEGFWKYQSDGAIRSMAQTRAQSKALKGALGFLVVLAGFNPTPAEEMPRDNDSPPPSRQTPPAESAEQVEARKAEGIKRIHSYCGTHNIDTKGDDSPYRRILLEEFADIFSDPAVPISSKALGLPELQRFSIALQKHVRERGAA